MTAVHMYYRDGDRVDIVEGERIRSVPLEAVATRVELLGYTDPADGLAACLAEMEQNEDDDSYPYDQIYEAYLPYLRRERGYRDTEEPAPAAVQRGSAAGPAAAAENTLAAALDEARRRARTQLGAPEPGPGRSAAVVIGHIMAIGRSSTDTGSIGNTGSTEDSGGTEETGAGSPEEALGRLRNEPLIAELRAEFRDQLVPLKEPRESI